MKNDDIFTGIVPKLAYSIIATVTAKHQSDQWISSNFSQVMSSDGRSAMFKLRIYLINGQVDASLRPDRDIREIIDDTWEKMFKRSGDIWYGFKLTVFPNGKHEIEYNYDPNCIDDPTFIDF